MIASNILRLSTLVILLSLPLRAAEIPPTNIETNVAAEATRLIRQVQSQLETSQRTIDALKEQAVMAKHNEEVTAARLKLIELTLTQRHERELSNLQSANRLTLTIVGVVGGIGLLGMIVLAVFLLRATTKLAELPAALANAPALGGGSPRGLLAGTTTAAANESLVSAVQVLEQRFRDFEQSLGDRGGSSTGTAAPGKERSVQLLARGQSLLNQDKADEALAAFEEAAAADPNLAEAQVKRGKALEKIGRMEDALKAYDRAIALDESLTVAYLGKGGVFNRLERFGEALECYERALKTQARTTTEAAKS